MPLLQISLLGTPLITWDGQNQPIRSQKTVALLAYLCLEPGPHSRVVLADLLWPNKPERLARQNLRQSLYQLRQMGGAGAPLFTATRWRITFHQQMVICDVLQFGRCVAAGDLGEAAVLYKGEFLAGVGVDDAPAFEEWARLIREELHSQALDALATLANQHEAAGRFKRALSYTRRLLALEPWRETSHRRMMRLLNRCGERSAALAQYEACQAVLADEFGVGPSLQTDALYETIRRGEIMTARQARIDDPPIEVPARAGRESQFAQPISPNGHLHEATKHRSTIPTAGSQPETVQYVLSPLIRKKLVHFFEMFDWDQKGAIEAKDFLAHAERLAQLCGIEPASALYRRLQQNQLLWWKALASVADRDGHGRVMLTDWLAFWATWAQAVTADLTDQDSTALDQMKDSIFLVFNLLDQDGDGRITFEEYARWLWCFSTAPDPEAAFERLDVDDDGYLTREEVLRYTKEFHLTNDPEAPGNHLYGMLFPNEN